MSYRRRGFWLCFLAVWLVLTGCGGSSRSSSPPATTVVVTISPPTTSLAVGGTQVFGAFVIGSSNVAVAFSRRAR